MNGVDKVKFFKDYLYIGVEFIDVVFQVSVGVGVIQGIQGVLVDVVKWKVRE